VTVLATRAVHVSLCTVDLRIRFVNKEAPATECRHGRAASMNNDLTGLWVPEISVRLFLVGLHAQPETRPPLNTNSLTGLRSLACSFA
jgi:hypothetical protein